MFTAMIAHAKLCQHVRRNVISPLQNHQKLYLMIRARSAIAEANGSFQQYMPEAIID